MRLTPAKYVIGLLGGVRSTARVLKYSPSAVSRWQTACRGEIPTKARKIILRYAEAKGLDIDPYDLEYGVDISKKK